MNTCENIREKLIYFIENRVAADSRSSIESHLSNCTECQQYMVFLKSEFEHLHIVASMQANPFLYTKIAAKLENKPSFYTLRKGFQVAIISAVIFVSIISGVGIASLFWSNYQTVDSDNSYSINSYSAESIEYAILETEDYK